MYFHNWLKKHGTGRAGGYVIREDVIKYLKEKKHPIAKKILIELHYDDTVMFIPIAVWEDECYNFKG